MGEKPWQEVVLITPLNSRSGSFSLKYLICFEREGTRRGGGGGEREGEREREREREIY